MDQRILPNFFFKLLVNKQLFNQSELSEHEYRAMKNKIIWLRVSYWVGAIADGLVTLRMLFPKIANGMEHRYALGVGASLMLGWTILLIWADKRPLERKGVILLTAFPVVTGLLLAEIYAVISGLTSFERMLPTGIFLMGLIILFSFSYFNAMGAEPEEQG